MTAPSRTLGLLTTLLLCAACIAGTTSAYAVLPPDGTIVPSFGNGAGRAGESAPLGEGVATSVAVQSDGKILTGVGSITIPQAYAQVTRRLPDGSLDPTFGTGGNAMLNVGSFNMSVNALAIDSQDRILAAGMMFDASFSTDPFVLRLLPDGSLDTSFGSSGLAQFNACNFVADGGFAVHVLADDSIILGGDSTPACSMAAMPTALVAKLDPSGALDTSFGGGDGYIDDLPVGTSSSRVVSIAEQPDGALLVAGQDVSSLSGFVGRITPAGAWDTSFADSDGVLDLAALRNVADVLLGSDGSVYVAGNTSGSRLATIKTTSAGVIDTTYGTSGVARSSAPADGTTFQPGAMIGTMGAVIAPNDTILVCASYLDSALMGTNFYDRGVVRFTTAGTMDMSFGGAKGVAHAHTGDWANAVEQNSACALDGAGRLIVVGSSETGSAGSPVTIPSLTAFALNTDYVAPTISDAAATVDPYSITFTIDAADNAGGLGLEDVDGAYSFDGGATWHATPSITITGLVPGASASRNLLARDRAGNVSAPFTAVATIPADSTPPTLQASTTSSYDTVTIDATASDAFAGMHATAYSFDGGLTWQAQPRFVRTGLRPGTTYVLEVKARDVLGNVATLLVNATTTDDGVPVVTPVDRAERSRGGVLNLRPGMRTYAVDNTFGTIVSMTATFRGKTVQLVDNKLNVRQLREGRGTLTIRATDSDGDVGEYSRQIRVDRSAPRVRTRSNGYVLGSKVRLTATDTVSGVRTIRRKQRVTRSKVSLTAKLPHRLGRSTVRVRVTDANGNTARRSVRVNRRLALGNQKLNAGIRPVTFAGDHVRPSAAIVHSSFRFMGYVPPWYPKHDTQTPFVAEAQWRLVRVGCLKPSAYEAGTLDLPTIRAVQAYQRSTKLPVLGTIGPRTRAKLDRDLLAKLPERCGKPARTT